MRNLLWLLLCGSLFLTNLCADSVQYQLTPLGGGSYQYQYFINGTFNTAYEVIDIQFDTSYTNVTNVSVLSGDWSSFILQPAPGGPSDYIAETLDATAPLTGTFAVKFNYSAKNGDPSIPGAQQFMFDQFDSNGNFVNQITPCNTCAPVYTQQQTITSSPAPEPASFGLSGMLLAGLIGLRRCRKARAVTAAR